MSIRIFWTCVYRSANFIKNQGFFLWQTGFSGKLLKIQIPRHQYEASHMTHVTRDCLFVTWFCHVVLFFLDYSLRRKKYIMYKRVPRTLFRSSNAREFPQEVSFSICMILLISSAVISKCICNLRSKFLRVPKEVASFYCIMFFIIFHPNSNDREDIFSIHSISCIILR